MWIACWTGRTGPPKTASQSSQFVFGLSGSRMKTDLSVRPFENGKALNMSVSDPASQFAMSPLSGHLYRTSHIPRMPTSRSDQISLIPGACCNRHDTLQPLLCHVTLLESGPRHCPSSSQDLIRSIIWGTHTASADPKGEGPESASTRIVHAPAVGEATTKRIERQAERMFCNHVEHIGVLRSFQVHSRDLKYRDLCHSSVDLGNRGSPRSPHLESRTYCLRVDSMS